MLNKTFHETVNPPKNTLRQSSTSKSQVPAIRPSNWNLLSRGHGVGEEPSFEERVHCGCTQCVHPEINALTDEEYNGWFDNGTSTVEDVQLYDGLRCKKCGGACYFWLVKLENWATETKWGKGVILLNEQDLDCLETVTRWFLKYSFKNDRPSLVNILEHLRNKTGVRWIDNCTLQTIKDMDVGAQQEVRPNCFAIAPLRGADTETQLAGDHLMQSAFHGTTSSNTVEDVGQLNQCPSNVNPIMEQFLASNGASVPVAIPTEPTQLPDGRGWIGFCKPDSIPTQCWSKKHLNLAWRNLPNKWKGSKNFIGNEEQTTVYEGLVASTSTSDGASKQAKLDDLRAVKYRCRPDCGECKYMHFC